MEDKTTCGISAVMGATGMRRADILAHIESGKIKGQKRGKLFTFNLVEKNRLQALSVEYIGFFRHVRNYEEESNLFSLKKRECRDEVIEFMTENAWFGADALKADDVFFANTDGEIYFVRKTDEAKFTPNIRLWIASYGESDENKLRLLLHRLRQLYPTTEALLSSFFEKEYTGEYAAAWRLTDFLCAVLTGEITKLTDETLDDVATKMDVELPLNSARMFSAFLLHLRHKRKLGNGWAYRFGSRSERTDNDAYPAPDFLKMAYIIFNEEAWSSEYLKEKAFQSGKNANLWLFTALHFVCGWRGSDIVRLPMPKLTCDGKTIRERLFAGNFDADSLLEEVLLRLRLAPMKPNKTESFDTPELKLFVAESLRKHLAFILATAASYQENISPGEAFIRRAGSVTEIRDFFGANFLAACGNKGFSTRRANKSYLQGLEAHADNAPGKPKGYMLAALARSHKGGYGALPRTTEIYLRDARFSGYSPEFVAREMFERGVFSFIPALLLDMYEGNRYAKLPASAQTQLMAEIGIGATGLEGLAFTVQRAFEKARRAVAEIMERPIEMRESVENILQNIASGNAPGRQDGFLCLMTAAGLACTDSDRSSCIGCGSEIYTKTILRLLISEYSRLLQKKKISEKPESDRCDSIIKKAVLPAISEILSSAERLCRGADIAPLLKELERGLALC